jgi:hypothetical protein
LPSLLVGPEAVPFDESERLCHLHHSMRETASGGNVEDRRRAIQPNDCAIDETGACRFDRAMVAHC